MIKEALENSIKIALWELKIEESKIPKINLEHPEDSSRGDYSTNIAMVLAKAVAQNPRELAEKIVAEINDNKPKEIKNVEMAGPGFINFFLSDSFFAEQIKSILKSEKTFGNNKKLKGQKTVIEYTDPNPFKEFHIGHLMNNTIGESVSRIIEANGAKIIRACYQGDVGLHVAKTIWGVQKMISEDPKNKKKFFDIKQGSALWGKAYAVGAKAYNDEEAKKVITEINKKVYTKSDKEVNKIYSAGRKASLKAFERVYKLLDTKFNNFFFESQSTKFGTDTVLKNIDNGIFERSNGAVIFKGENYGLHTRVFINSEGLPTYEAKDLGLAKLKDNTLHYDKSIIVTANEQSAYFTVLLKAMSLIFPDLAEKTSHISHGMLRMPSGKMSSRTGDVVSATSLLKDIEERVMEKMVDRKMTKKEKAKVAEWISVASLRYSILKQMTGKDIIFDFDKSLSFEGDSGPYLQYSYARAKSVLRKAVKERVKIKAIKIDGEVSEIEKILYRFPEIVERAGEEYAPNYIATYLIQLSSVFNGYYANNKIVDKEDKNSAYRLAITKAFSIVLKNGLKLLGISAPEKM
ncbi:MAG: arginine--tRNA ligase [Candidatus Paceibacterota bacterium]|jgi:arginyl-tRNA synthetase